MFLHETPKDWAFQVHMYAYAHNSQPLSERTNLLLLTKLSSIPNLEPPLPLTKTLTEMPLKYVIPNIVLHY